MSSPLNNGPFNRFPMASFMSHVLCVHGPWLNGHVSDSRLYAMYFRAVSLCLRAIRARALGGDDDKRAAAAYPKLRLPSSYLLSLVLEKEEGYVVASVVARNLKAHPALHSLLV